MSRHTIGNKRGSVRGAPPQVYLPFGSLDSDPGYDPLAEACTLFKQFAIFALGWVLIVVLVVILWAAGIIPDEFMD